MRKYFVMMDPSGKDTIRIHAVNSFFCGVNFGYCQKLEKRCEATVSVGEEMSGSLAEYL